MKKLYLLLLLIPVLLFSGCEISGENRLEKSLFEKGEQINIDFPTNLYRKYVDVYYSSSKENITNIGDMKKVDSITLNAYHFSYTPSQIGHYLLVGYYYEGDIADKYVIEFDVR